MGGVRQGGRGPILVREGTRDGCVPAPPHLPHWIFSGESARGRSRRSRLTYLTQHPVNLCAGAFCC